jgi:hypothetical protein
MVGNYLFAPDNSTSVTQEGPRLGDLNVSSAADGTDIPILWGTGRMAGQVIWTEGINEKVKTTTSTQSTGGKGGGGSEFTTTTTSYSYSCSFACSFGLFESSAVRRIWANKKLIYDVREEASGTSMTGLNFIFYGGSETQEPNATIEAHVGTGNASAYRGQTYLVFNSLPLAQFGNRVPSIEVEFTATGTPEVVTSNIPVSNSGGFSTSFTAAWPAYDPYRNLLYQGVAYSGSDAPTITTLEGEQVLPVTFEPLPENSLASPTVLTSGSTYCVVYNDSVQSFQDLYTLPPTKMLYAVVKSGSDDWYWYTYNLNTRSVGDNKFGALADEGLEVYAESNPIFNERWGYPSKGPDYRKIVWNGVFFIKCHLFGVGPSRITNREVLAWTPYSASVSWARQARADDITSTQRYLCALTSTSYGSYMMLGDIDPNSAPTYQVAMLNEAVGGTPSTFVLVGCSYPEMAPGLIKIRLAPGAVLGGGGGGSPIITSVIIDQAFIDKYSTNNTGVGGQHFPWAMRYNPHDGRYWMLWTYNEGTGSTANYGTTRWAIFNADSLELEEEINCQSWVDLDTDTDSIAGWFFSEETGKFFFFINNSGETDGEWITEYDTISRVVTEYNVANTTVSLSGEICAYNANAQTLYLDALNGKYIKVRLRSVGSGTVGIATIITDLCGEVGITPSEIDVSSVSNAVTGFRHSRRSEARKDMESLLIYDNIDAVQSDWTLKFQPRGGSSAVTVPTDDMGAFEDGNEPTHLVERTIAQSVEKPSSLDLMYMSVENDFQPANALTTWYTGGSQRKATVTLPIFLPDANAAFASERLLLQSVDSDEFKFYLPRKYAYLEPTDPITITANGEERRVRILEITHGANDMLEVRAVLDDVDHLTSYAAASGSGIPGTTIVQVTYAEPVLIDTSLIRDADNDQPGPYMSAFTWSDGFRPVVLYRSADGQQYDEFAGIGVEPTIGVVQNSSLTVVDWEDWDTTNVLTVRVLNGAFNSLTEAQVLSGTNAVAWGRPGAWEIIQFQDATLVDTDTYEIETLLRGRRNTQWAKDLHRFGDYFILLGTDGSLIRNVQTNADIGSTVYYKTVISGTFIADAIENTYVTGEEPLKPYSPIQLAHGGAGADYDLTWTRRTRRGGSYGGDNTLTDGVGGTLSEDSEEYELDIFEAADMTTPVRTVTAISSASYTYTAATATSDGFGAGDTIVFRVYQISAVVGRGHPSDDLYIQVGNNSTTIAAGSFNFRGNGFHEFVIDTYANTSTPWREGIITYTAHAPTAVTTG